MPQQVALGLVHARHPRIWGLLRFPGDSDGKDSACNAGDSGSIPVSEDPWQRARHPPPVFLPGESHGQRSLAGYSPWGHTESDMSDWHAHKLFLNSVYIPETQHNAWKAGGTSLASTGSTEKGTELPQRQCCALTPLTEILSNTFKKAKHSLLCTPQTWLCI